MATLRNGIVGEWLQGDKSQKTKNPAEAGFKIGRRERIRTSDPLVPNQLRYQAALLAECGAHLTALMHPRQSLNLKKPFNWR